jgi:diguanylate cyclase (GGDEF)-like protein
MPQPPDATRPPSGEDSFLELLVEVLDSMDAPVRGQFLQRFFKSIAQLDLSDQQSLDYWEQILTRRRELVESLGRRVSLKTAMLDVLASTSSIRVPILMEYDDFKKLQINAATDALTGLYNRRLFEEYCEKELNRAKRYSQPLALVILDLHRLKEINDRYGHLQGDQSLQMAAATLRKTMRASDFAFRIGGDEFALLLPQTDPEQATILCRRVRAHFESEMAPLKLDVPVTLDFGVAVHPQDGDEKEGLLRLADERLYQLKRATRGSSRGISLEPPAREVPPPQPPREIPSAPVPVRPSASATPIPSIESSRPKGAERRKWERVSLTGTRAYAVLGGNGSQRTAPVIDLSYGGVALELDHAEDLPTPFYAVLHVPILPPVRVSLRRTYTMRGEGDRSRVGCSFVS